MEYSYKYKAALFCLFTVVCMGSNCEKHKVNKNYTQEAPEREVKAPKDNHNYQQEVPQRKVAENNPINKTPQKKTCHERFEALWESKKKPNKEQIMQQVELQSQQVLQSTQTEKEKSDVQLGIELRKKFMQQNMEFLTEHYNTYMQQLKKWCLRLSPEKLQPLVPKLEKVQGMEDIGKFVEEFMQVAPPDVIEEFRQFKIKANERYKPRFREFIQKPEILKELPKEAQEEIREKIQEELKTQ